MGKIKYPTRCRIIDVNGLEHPLLGFTMRTPAKSEPHIDKKGLAEIKKYRDFDRVKITLDDGNIIYGDECWWVPIKENET